MEAFLLLVLLLFISIPIGILIWISRASDRLKSLEQETRSLRAQVARLEKAATASSPPAEAPPASTKPEKPRASNAFTEAKERTQNEAAPEPQPQSPPPTRPETEEETEPEEKVAPPPFPVAKASPATTPPPRPEPKPPKPTEPEKPRIEWRPILEKLNLIPPSGKNAEAAILSWWLPRVGVVVLIIAAVFAGIYFSRDVPAWLWILGLSGISAAVTIFGLWLERRVEAFGRLVSTAGLGIGYFTAFAAFALPATKVIDEPVLGVLVQVLALAIMIGWSLWKNDRSVAAMAVLLGYVSVGFSHHHDLNHFVIAGLLLLAAAGGTLIVIRRWLWPHAVATAGSWGGFFILAVGEWTRPGEAPEFPLMLGCLLLLTAILEAANFLAEERAGDSPDSQPRERKWLSIFNTSAAIAIGWIATRQVAPDQLANFFLAFAILLFGITSLRFWRKHPVGLTETFFLKTSALLALFFVEKYQGPTRWLSLAIEAGLVLWAFRRSGYRMIEAGFAAVFLCALGLIWKDVLIDEVPETWTLLSFPSFAGAATLVLLSFLLGLHSLWSTGPFNTEKRAESTSGDTDPVQVFRMLAAVFTGLAAAAFAFALATESKGVGQPIFLSLVALALAAPAIYLKRFPPVAAGLAAIVPAYVRLLEYSSRTDHPAGGFVAAIWLTLLAIGLAEVAYRFWLKRWHGGNVVRTVFYGLGFLALADFISRLDSRFELGTPLAAIITLLFAAAGAGIVIGMSRRFDKDHVSANPPLTHVACQWILALFLGGLSVFSSIGLLGDRDSISAWLTISGGIFFAAAFRSKNSVPALAGGISFLTAIGWFFVDGMAFGDDQFGTFLLCALVLIGISIGTALVLLRFANYEKFREVRWFEAILQAVALFVIHWVFRNRLEVSEVFFADALLALGAIAASRNSPLRALRFLASLPLAFALVHAGVASLLDFAWGGQVFWWLAALGGTSWILYLVSPRFGNDPRLDDWLLHLWNVAAVSGFVTVASFHTLDSPWHLVVLTAISCILASLWRWEKVKALQFASLLPLTVAGVGALFRANGLIETENVPGLVAVSLTAAGIVGHGVLLAFRNPDLRPATWVSGLAALALVFLAYAPGALGVSELTTVCWGIASILVFATGLVAGLRPLRLSGLVGLGCCIIRMFIIDIDDALWRIWAFFGIAVVLLAMGYAYHRFRHLIERADYSESESK